MDGQIVQRRGGDQSIANKWRMVTWEDKEREKKLSLSERFPPAIVHKAEAILIHILYLVNLYIEQASDKFGNGWTRFARLLSCRTCD